MTLGRGHWFEQGVAEAFAALDLRQMRQLEIACTLQSAPIRGHLDIVLIWPEPNPAVRIIEIKSMENLPTIPHASHEWQVSAQTGLLRKYWSEPVFSVGIAKGRTRALSFPDLCKHQLGLQVPATVQDCSVEGWLLCLSMRDALAFGPYIPDREFMEQLSIQAGTLWQQLQGINTGRLGLEHIPHAQGFQRLCPWCLANADCPQFSDAAMQPQWEPAIAHLDELKTNRAKLETEIKEVEAALRFAHAQSGIKDWISTEQHRFRVINSKGRMSLDRNLLQAELENLFQSRGMDDIDATALLSRCEREGAASSRLSIQPINKEQ